MDALKVDEELETCERKRLCAVHDPGAFLVPSATDDQTTRAAERIVRILFLADSVDSNQAR